VIAIGATSDTSTNIATAIDTATNYETATAIDTATDSEIATATLGSYEETLISQTSNFEILI
jgi:hypothetical protein